MSIQNGDPGSPADDIVAVTPSDVAVLAPTRAIWVGGAGNIAVLPAGQDSVAVTITGVAAGTLLPIRVVQVLSTGTTATGIVALR